MAPAPFLSVWGRGVHCIHACTHIVLTRKHRRRLQILPPMHTHSTFIRVCLPELLDPAGCTCVLLGEARLFIKADQRDGEGMWKSPLSPEPHCSTRSHSNQPLITAQHTKNCSGPLADVGVYVCVFMCLSACENVACEIWK